MKERQFKNRLLSILSHNAIERPLEREKSGKINAKRLGRALTSERVFRKRGDTHVEKNWNISILIDSSGSMDGEKRTQAKEATNALAKVLSSLKWIDFEIAEFGNTDIILKPYGRKYTGKELNHYSNQGNSQTNSYYLYSNGSDLIDAPRNDIQIAGYNVAQSGGYGGTNDTLALFRASRRLSKQSGNKILIVMSDGSPTGDGTFMFTAKAHETLRGSVQERKVLLSTADPDSALKQVANQIKREKQIILLGVGIQARDVERYYPQNTIVRDLPDFFSKMSSLLAKQIKKV